MMGEPLRVLIVGDSQADAMLVVDRLRSAGYHPVWERVETPASMETALDEKTWDLVIADYSMPRFSLSAALALLRGCGLDLPFIIISETMDEETAIAAIRAGAHDYIRRDNLERLAPAVERELSAAAARREHRRVEEALLESLQTSMETVQAMPSGLFIYQHRPPDGLVLAFGNPEAERLAGIRIDEYLGKNLDEIWPEARELGITESFLDVMRTGEMYEAEELFYNDENLRGFFRVRAFPMAGTRLGVAFDDVSDQRRAAEALAWEPEVNVAMAELSKTLLEPASIEDVSLLVLEYAKRFTGSQFGYVGYIESSTGYLISTTLTKEIWETCQVPDKDVIFKEFHGLWGWVLKNRKPLLTNSPSLDIRSSGTPEGHIPIRSFLSVPAMIGDTLVGQVALANSNRDYSDRDLNLVERLAALYAIAIGRMRAQGALREALEESRKRASETSALLESSRAILEREEFEETGRVIFDSCKNLVGATAGYIALLSEDETNNDLIFLDSGGRPCTVDENLPMPVRGLRTVAYAHAKPAYENNFMESKWIEFLPQGHASLDNVMFAPLIIGEKVVGVIGLANKPGGFTDDDSRIVSAFADQAAIALQNSGNLEALRNSETRYRELSESLEQTVKEKVAQLRQAESLAAVGRMVSIVAHEIRNPLQNIQMGVDSIRKEVEEDDNKVEILQEIEYGVNLLNGIIVELLDYSRPFALTYSLCSVGDLVSKALKTMPQSADSINLSLHLEEEDRQVSVDALKINAVLINLLSNAIDAMPRGGDLTISSKFYDANGKSILKLLVSDTGCGIGDEDIERVYEPFFTTKTRGTGLGLSVCKKIIEAHDGEFTLQSALDGGTTAEIKLPVEKP